MFEVKMIKNQLYLYVLKGFIEEDTQKTFMPQAQ